MVPANSVEWLSSQLDYIHFAHGNALVAVALISWFLWNVESNRREKPAWHLLGLFGLTCGIGEWLELAAVLGYGAGLATGAGLLLTAVGYLALLEFGRRGTPPLSGARAAGALYGPLVLLALAGLSYGPAGVAASVRYFLGLPAGGLAAWAFFMEYRKRPAGERTLFLPLSVAFAVLAFSIAVGEAFLRLTGVPLQLLEGLVAGAVAVLLGGSCLLSDRPGGRRPVFGFALALSMLAAVGGGWYLTEFQGRKAARVLQKDIRTDVVNLVTHVDVTLETVRRTARNIAEYPALGAALSTRTPAALAQANALLDQHQKTMGVAVCYLMSEDGLTIASSNRAAHDSFVGKSYAFRPYFTEAIAGRPGQYFALGVTSGERGYYAGSAVLDAAGRVRGVAVVKKELDSLAEAFANHREQFLLSPEGVIFMSGSTENLFRTLWPVDAGTRAALQASRQFGAVSFAPLLGSEPVGASYLSRSGRATYALRAPISVAGWSVVLLHEATAISVARAQGIGLTFVVSLMILFAFMLLVYSERTIESSLALLEQRQRNEEVLNEQLFLQQFLSGINGTLQRPEALAAVLQQDVEIIVRHLDAAFARIWVLNPASQLLELRASAGLYTRLDGAHAGIPLGRGKIGEIAQQGRPYITNAVVGDPGILDQEWARREGMRAFAGYPLLVEGRVTGVLGVFARGPLKETVLETLGLAANSLASFIDRKRAEAALRTAHDELEAKVRERTGDLVREIEERTSAQAALARSEQRLKEAQKTARIGSWDLDLGMDTVAWSDETFELFGVDRRTFVPTYAAFLNLVCPAHRERVDQQVRGALQGGHPHQVEAGVINPDGQVWIMESSGHLIRDDSGAPVRFSATIQDITERREVEEERLQFERLLQSQKFQSLGTLAGGIAHQFNNLMSVVTLNLEMALRDATVGPVAQARIASAAQAVQRTSDLTRQILSYSGKGRFFVERRDVGELLKEHHRQLRAAVPPAIRLELHVEGGLPVVEVDAAQVHQAIMNLTINAAEAIDEKLRAAAGTKAGPEIISLTTGVVECDERYLQRSRTGEELLPGTYVYVEVSDTGCGMDEETRRRLFDPFFSTKFLGRGLGMAAVLGIVRSHRGGVLVESSPGAGSRIRLLFPVAEG